MNSNVKPFPNETANLDIVNKNDINLIAKVCNALASPLRINILKQLQDGPHTIPELAEMNDISVTNCVFHTSILAEAAVIRIELVPGETRNVRMCYRLLRGLNLNLFLNEGKVNKNKIYRNSCSVGQYVDISDDCDIKYTTKDNICLFEPPFSPARHNAGIVWSPRGTITYAFPNQIADDEALQEIEINVELCSEVVTYNNEYKSDITFWLNDIELFTHRSPGDYGDRPGLISPEWYKNYFAVSQYGDYYHIKMTPTGVYLNDVLVNKKVNISSFKIKRKKKILLKIGNKNDSEYIGGWNIFGKDFGDYPIDIELNVSVISK